MFKTKLPQLLFALFLVGNSCQQSVTPDLPVTKGKFEFEEDGKTGAAYFAQAHALMRTSEGEAQPSYTGNYKISELNKALKNNQNRAVLRNTLSWQERGPGNVGGRVRGLALDPTDPNYETWFVGSVGGGLWKTSDAGVSWTHLTTGLPNLATSTVAISPNNPDVIYLGTGEGFSSLDIKGSGVWKSLDRGNTWNQLEATANDDVRFGHITRLIVDPDNENEVILSTRSPFLLDGAGGRDNGYVLKSTDGGNSWTVTLSDFFPIQQLIANPLNFKTIYASINSRGIFKSVDKGETWKQVFKDDTNRLFRMEIAISPSDTNTIYFSAQSEVKDFELFKSKDGGKEWFPVTPDGPENDFGVVFSGQGWYDNTIAVNPYDPEEVYIGGAGPILKINTSNVIGANVQIFDLSDNIRDIDIVEQGNLGNGVQKGAEVALNFGLESQTTNEEYGNVEVVFGTGNVQKGYRFTVDDSNNLVYQELVDLPFVVRDIERNQQVSVSFVDINNDGLFGTYNEQELEPFIISTINYQGNNANFLIVNNPFQKSSWVPFLEFDTERDVVSDLFNYPNGSLVIRSSIVTSVPGIPEPITDGYLTFRNRFPNVGVKGVHVDHHNLIFIPIDSVSESFYILNANDGGVAFSRNSGQTFVQTGSTFDYGFNNALNGFNTSQFYGVDKMNGADRYVGGTQDNGSWLSPDDPSDESEWVPLPSGDGFEAVWHYTDADLILESYQFNGVFRSNNGGNDWFQVNIPGEGPFITRLTNSKQEPDLVFAVSSEGVVRSNDFGLTWEVIPMEPSWRFSELLGPPIDISLVTPTIVWTGGGMTEELSIQVSTNSGQSFSPTPNYEQANMGRLTGIATHPTNALTAYILFSQANAPKILRTTDLGETWEDISGFIGNSDESNNGFPDVAVYSLLVMPYDTDIIWVGTEIGLFESTDGGESWHLAENGLPATAIWEMKIVNDEVVVATHGRGIWTVSLPELEGYEPPAAIELPEIVFEGDAMNGNFEGAFVFDDGIDSVRWLIQIPNFDNNAYDSGWFGIENEQQNVPFSTQVTGLPPNEILSAKIIVSGKSGGLEYNSSKSVLTYVVAEQPVISYEQTFDGGNDQMALGGLQIDQAGGFSSRGLQSPHPYENKSRYLSVLQVPFLISENENAFSFDEVALVEPGEQPDLFLEDEIDVFEFYDYVVVEGTNDFGKSWIPFEFWDARLDDAWKQVFENRGSGNEDLIRRHEIDLGNKFAAGDTVYLRFNLTSDPAAVGWGWWVDNLLFNRSEVTATEDIPEPSHFIQVFPNPVQQFLQVKVAAKVMQPVTLSVFDLSGRRLIQRPPGQMVTGEQLLEINVEVLPAGTYFLKVQGEGFERLEKFVKF